MVYDLKVLKDLGFNMVRKHIKVETDLFYRSCDELGLMVIQDMPNLRLSGDIPGVIGEAPKLTKEANSEREEYALLKSSLVTDGPRKRTPSIRDSYSKWSNCTSRSLASSRG